MFPELFCVYGYPFFGSVLDISWSLFLLVLYGGGVLGIIELLLDLNIIKLYILYQF